MSDFRREFSNLRVVLVRPRNPLNIGAAARAMSNFGASRLRLVKPYDVAFREARSAVGAHQVLTDAEVFESVSEAVEDCALVVGTSSVAHRVLDLPVKPLSVGAKGILRQCRTAPAAILFGSEKIGLTNEEMSHCHWLIRIPTREQHISMNLAQSVAVCLYELIRSQAPTSKKGGGGAILSPTIKELDRITALLMETLNLAGYVPPKLGAATEEKVRKMIRRLKLNQQDAGMWQGIFRQVLWKLKEKKEDG